MRLASFSGTVALLVSYSKQNACSCFKGGLKVVLQGVTSFEQSKSVGFKHIAGWREAIDSCMEALDWCMKTHLDDNSSQRILWNVMYVLGTVWLYGW
jgi:hypothetical protein